MICSYEVFIKHYFVYTNITVRWMIGRFCNGSISCYKIPLVIEMEWTWNILR